MSCSMVAARKRARTSSKKKEKIRKDVGEDTEDADVVFEEAGNEPGRGAEAEQAADDEDTETAAAKRLRLGEPTQIVVFVTPICWNVEAVLAVTSKSCSHAYAPAVRQCTNNAYTMLQPRRTCGA